MAIALAMVLASVNPAWYMDRCGHSLFAAVCSIALSQMAILHLQGPRMFSRQMPIYSLIQVDAGVLRCTSCFGDTRLDACEYFRIA